MADWLRLWHGTVTDTKFLWVARRSGARFGDVMAVWLALLEEASQADQRGDVSGFDAESFDCLLGAVPGWAWPICGLGVTLMIACRPLYNVLQRWGWVR